MKIHVTPNEEIKNTIRQGLVENHGYCPCIVDSFGKEEYKCLCEDFRLNVPAGHSCHCGLYIKDED
jgi:ferredoxin-thioredoxin reductase catalytic subunit